MSETLLRLRLDEADRYAAELVEAFTPACVRIEIAGSVRRRCRSIGDIEIVAIPRRVGLMEDSALDPVLQELVAAGKLQRINNGERAKRFLIEAAACKLDLFLVEPATWGVQLALRTGPAEFSRRLVTPKHLGGYLPPFHRVQDGRLHCAKMSAVTLETPEEADFFRLLLMDWIEPKDRV